MADKEFVVRHGLVVGEDNVLTANAQTGVVIKNLVVNSAANLSMTTLRSATRPTLLWDARYTRDLPVELPIIGSIQSGPKSYVDENGTVVFGELQFTHDGETGESKGYLFEYFNTNLITRSLIDTNNYQRFSNLSITANTYTAPDGNTTATKIGLVTTDGIHYFWKDNSGQAYTANTPYTVSVFVKETPDVPSPGFFVLRFPDAAFNKSNSGLVYVVTELANTANIYANGGNFVSATAERYGNGWVRLSATANCVTTATTTSPIMGIPYSPQVNTNMELQVWGHQLEQSRSASSYIPTEGSQVSRRVSIVRASSTKNAEFFNKVYNANTSQGTMFVEFELPRFDNTSYYDTCFLSLSRSYTSSTTTSIAFRTIDGELVVVSEGVSIANVAISERVNYSAAIGFTEDTAQFALNGTLYPTASPAIVDPNYTTIHIGSTSYSQSTKIYIKRIAFYPKKLSDAELIALTKKNS